MTENAVLAAEIERRSLRQQDYRAKWSEAAATGFSETPSRLIMLDAANEELARLIADNLPAILSALRSHPEPAADAVEAAALRVADATLCQWGKPNDCGREGEKCLCEEAAKAVLAALPRPEADEGAVVGWQRYAPWGETDIEFDQLYVTVSRTRCVNAVAGKWVSDQSPVWILRIDPPPSTDLAAAQEGP